MIIIPFDVILSVSGYKASNAAEIQNLYSRHLGASLQFWAEGARETGKMKVITGSLPPSRELNLQ